MRGRQLTFVMLMAIIIFALTVAYYHFHTYIFSSGYPIINLPNPAYSSNVSIEQALKTRRTIREYADKPITLHQLGQLLWAAQGITSPEGSRTAPSAGPTYPLELYVVAKNVTGLTAGVYHYVPALHSLEQLSTANKMNDIYIASSKQAPLLECPAAIIITGEYDRTIKKYGNRGVRYVQLEAGTAAENIELQAVSLHLGTVSMGGFSDAMIIKALDISPTLTPLFIMPVGNIAH